MVDYNSFKEQIMQIIENEELGFRDIIKNSPYFNEIPNVTKTPVCYVTSDQELDRITPVGTIVTGGVAQYKHELRFGIIIVTSASDGRRAEQEIDTLTADVVNTMNNNPHLSLLDDRKAALSFVEGVSGRELGNNKLARYILLKVQITE